ncbi:MAG: response regulator transcription factor [Microbacteriaceae bacterium]|nr:response regulator transcription factor [Microbacteriaceae bacterium]
MPQQHILLVEDEPAISQPLYFLLQQEGYEVTVIDDGARAAEEFDVETHDLVLLDLMLPSMSGTEVCRIIRQQAQTPIIMLTAKDSEIDVIVGLEIGADDYIKKPYSSRELLARIRAVLRRTDSEDEVGDENTLEPGKPMACDDVVLDPERHTLNVRGEAVTLPLREFELLEMLMANDGRVLTRGQLIDRIWGSNYYGDTKTLDVHIKRLRSRIERDPSDPRLITTVRGVGYRFN